MFVFPSLTKKYYKHKFKNALQEPHVAKDAADCLISKEDLLRSVELPVLRFLSFFLLEVVKEVLYIM